MFMRLLSLLALLICAALPARAEVVIFAASSLKSALDEVLADQPAVTSYGGSGALARQIMQGAPADIFLSANPDWMDAVQQAGALRAGSRVDLLSNTLVIAGPAGQSIDAMLAGDGRVATGLTASVPVGIYGKATLQRMGHWPAMAPRVVEVDSARAALTLAARGEVPYAVVYATDARAEPRVTVIATLPSFPDLPILYPAAMTARAGQKAEAVMTRLTSPEARAIFTAHGFGIP